MKISKLWLLPLSLVLGLSLVFAFVKASQSYLSEYMVENSKDLIGQKLEIAGLASYLRDQSLVSQPQDLLLVFWSTTCSPCLQELPTLSQGGQYKVIPINIDRLEHQADAERVFKILAPSFQFVNDSDEFLQKSFKIKYVPTNVWITSAGVIDKIKIGAFKDKGN